MLHFVVRVRAHECAQHVVVGVEIRQHAVHVAQAPQPRHFVDVGLLGVLVDDLGGRERIADLRVDAHEQVHFVAIGRAGVELVFEFHHQVRQHVRLGGEQHELILGERPPGGVAHVQPQRPPRGERVRLAIRDAVEPRQAHALVVAEAAFGVAQRFQQTHRPARFLQALVGVGQIAYRRVGRGQDGLQPFQRRQGVGVAAAGEVGLEQEQERRRGFAALRHVPLDHGQGLLAEAHVDHALTALEQHVQAVGVARLQVRPHGQRLIFGGDVHVVAGQARVPAHRGRLGGDETLVFGDHVLGPSGRLVELDQAAARGHVHGVAYGFVEGDGVVVALGLDEQIHACAGEVGVVGAALGHALVDGRQQRAERVVAAVRFHQDRQRVEGVRARPGGVHRPPRLGLGAGPVGGGDGPLGEANMLAERGAEIFACLVDFQRFGGMTENPQRPRGAVAIGLVAFAGQPRQRVHVALARLRHGQAQTQKLLLLTAVAGGDGPLVPIGGGRGVAFGIQQAPFEQQAVGGFQGRQRLVGGRQRGVRVAVAPEQVGDDQPDVGQLARRPVLPAGEDAQPFDRAADAGVGEDRFVVQRRDAADIQALRIPVYAQGFGQRRSRRRRRVVGAEGRQGEKTRTPRQWTNRAHSRKLNAPRRPGPALIVQQLRQGVDNRLAAQVARHRLAVGGD